MHPQPVLNAEEWELVTELLSIEHADLPVEIHHCRSAAMREDLRRRLRLVEGLLQRLREPVVA